MGFASMCVFFVVCLSLHYFCSVLGLKGVFGEALGAFDLVRVGRVASVSAMLSFSRISKGGFRADKLVSFAR